MFEDSTFDSAGRIHTRSRRWMIVAFTFNASILLALILIPLISPEALPHFGISVLITVPAPFQQPRPEPTAETPRPQTDMQDGHIFAPSRIPPNPYIATGPEPAPLGDPAARAPLVPANSGLASSSRKRGVRCPSPPGLRRAC
jgi:hypothetical protein